MIETGYSNLSREEDGGNQSDSTQVSDRPTAVKGQEKLGLYASLRQWWIRHLGNTNESAPLINRHRMSLEPPRKSTVRVAIEIISCVSIFALIAVFIMLSVGTDDLGGTKEEVV